jgi:hypothetical protein
LISYTRIYLFIYVTIKPALGPTKPPAALTTHPHLAPILKKE